MRLPLPDIMKSWFTGWSRPAQAATGSCRSSGCWRLRSYGPDAVLGRRPCHVTATALAALVVRLRYRRSCGARRDGRAGAKRRFLHHADGRRAAADLAAGRCRRQRAVVAGRLTPTIFLVGAVFFTRSSSSSCSLWWPGCWPSILVLHGADGLPSLSEPALAAGASVLGQGGFADRPAVRRGCASRRVHPRFCIAAAHRPDRRGGARRPRDLLADDTIAFRAVPETASSDPIPRYWRVFVLDRELSGNCAAACARLSLPAVLPHDGGGTVAPCFWTTMTRQHCRHPTGRPVSAPNTAIACGVNWSPHLWPIRAASRLAVSSARRV